MKPLLYGQLTPWYRLLDPPADHRDEARVFQAAFERAISPRPSTLLELGAGGGHNALHLKARFRCTLTDLSDEMVALSRELNPECEHVAGDMRSLRLGKTFDAVLVHDAICYMRTVEDLRAAAETAFVHTRSGGAAIFAPDAFRETFEDATELLSQDEPGRSLRGMMWTWDPDPTDDTYSVEFAFLLREGKKMTAAHDTHVEGLFEKAVWERVLGEVGFAVETMARPIDEARSDEVFLCRKP